MLEQNMRDLEDAWPSGGNGGTAQSILSVTSFSGSYGNGNTDFTADVDVPNDPAFTYYLDWNIHGIARPGFSSADSNDGMDFAGVGSIDGQGGGAGFESWGWHITIPPNLDMTGAGFGPYATGHGRRLEGITTPLLGTTITFRMAVTASSTSGNANGSANGVCLLVAIPV